MRSIRTNAQLGRHIKECYEQIKPVGIDAPILVSQKGTVFTIQRINVILKEVKKKYRLKCYTFINGDTGEIISWNNFYISDKELDEFNKVVKEYSGSTKIIPNIWKLVDLCFKDEHLKVPTLEELQSVPSIKEETINRGRNLILYDATVEVSKIKQKNIQQITKYGNFYLTLQQEKQKLLTLMKVIFKDEALSELYENGRTG